MTNLESLKKDYDALLEQLSDPELISDWEKFEALSQQKKHLEKVIEKGKEIEEMKNQILQNKSLISSEQDRELISLAETEITILLQKQALLEKELAALLEKASLVPSGRENLLKSDGEKETKEGKSSAIMEIRAGTGGDEASIFVADLFRMYSRYAQIQGWKQKVLDSHSTELGGYKEIIFELEPARNASHSDAGGNGNVYSKMKYEGGVHRVQRIPTTEKLGRVHTSTVSVAVLMKPKPTEFKINPKDLKIDIAKASGPGGQNVNKRMTAVRILHIPTGIMVKSMAERTLPQNKENALSILAARLLEIEQTEKQKNIEGKRNKQIGSAKRAEKIRTYNFPQDRVTDHRIKKSFHDLEGIMEGKLDPLFEALQKELKD